MNFGILSDLFNACTNSPFPEKALEDANRLRKSLVEENFVLPEVTYNNMIKAFGRCGDLETAFSLVDEMSRNNIPITTDTFNHLLYGCVADKYSGFRHAILTWRKLLETKRVRPNLTTVNLLLGATRGDLISPQSIICSFAYHFHCKFSPQIATWAIPT